ncbi:dihydroxyacetone kinase subunit DhaL [Amycolatopsis thermophila]|uniref:Dihydroxyacetone kinase-like protein n=1 Tax=Amycolatopsis thermophila TaxID=206084 RepID=A0ABU0EZT1_9PSEU|nr:dihydroxyacetone kinase subunit DhaL [Amycolatopsis thermophila]MDQ0380648.1 dihydroxyacetone kinase-like protein [Amycolatopsis thermophila]
MDSRKWIERFAAVIDERGAELTELDRRAGDGDFGTNLRSALGRVRANLAADDPSTPDEVFTAVSTAFLNTGGTSGPLFGMWFREFAKGLGDEVSIRSLAAAAGEAEAVVRRLGGAEVGHKTMVDAMVPAAEALAAAASRGADVETALKEAAAAADAGARSTAELLAKRGRASYVGEHARGVVDPGALTVAWFFEAATAA